MLVFNILLGLRLGPPVFNRLFVIVSGAELFVHAGLLVWPMLLDGGILARIVEFRV